MESSQKKSKMNLNLGIALSMCSKHCVLSTFITSLALLCRCSFKNGIRTMRCETCGAPKPGSVKPRPSLGGRRFGAKRGLLGQSSMGTSMSIIKRPKLGNSSSTLNSIGLNRANRANLGTSMQLMKKTSSTMAVKSTQAISKPSKSASPSKTQINTKRNTENKDKSSKPDRKRKLEDSDSEGLPNSDLEENEKEDEKEDEKEKVVKVQPNKSPINDPITKIEKKNKKLQENISRRCE